MSIPVSLIQWHCIKFWHCLNMLVNWNWKWNWRRWGASLKMQQYNRAQNNLLSALANSSTLMCECTEHMSVYLLAFKMKNVIWLHVKWVKYWKTLRLLNAQIQAMCVQRETKKDERRRRRNKKNPWRRC